MHRRGVCRSHLCVSDSTNGRETPSTMLESERERNGSVAAEPLVVSRLSPVSQTQNEVIAMQRGGRRE